MKLQINTSELTNIEISALKMFFKTLENNKPLEQEDDDDRKNFEESLREIEEIDVREIGGTGGGGSGNPGFGGGYVCHNLGITALDAGLELDINGLSWDAAIHTKSKSKTPEGAWKLKRNLETKEKPEDHSTFIAPGAKLELPQEIIELDKVVTFNDLFLLIRQEIDAGKIIAADVITGLKNLGYAELPQLKDNPEGINALIKVLGIGHE